MGIYINGKKQGKPYINGIAYNGYLNGSKIWLSLPVNAMKADQYGWVYMGNSTKCGEIQGYYCDLSYDVYNSSGVKISTNLENYEVDYGFDDISVYIGIGNYLVPIDCDCSFS